jgi:hypothetical protein
MVNRFLVPSSTSTVVREENDGRLSGRGDVETIWIRLIGSRDLSEEVELELLNEQLVILGRKKIWTLHMLYMTTKYWQRIRKLILERDGYACVECKSVHDLQVDHKKYEKTFGNECAENLQTMCRICHGSKTKKFDLMSWSSKATIIDFNGDMQLFSALRRAAVRGGVGGRERISDEVGRDSAIAVAGTK